MCSVRTDIKDMECNIIINETYTFDVEFECSRLQGYATVVLEVCKIQGVEEEKNKNNWKLKSHPPSR